MSLLAISQHRRPATSTPPTVPSLPHVGIPPWEGPSQFPTVPTTAAQQLTLANTITPELLKWHFDDAKCRKGDAPGADGVRLSQVSDSEAWDICRGMTADIQRGTWQPGPPREFQREKRDGTHRTIEVRDAFTRCVSATVAVAISPIVKRVVPRTVASVHGGVHQALLLLQCAATELGYFAVAPDDISHAFDNVPVADSVRDFARYIPDPRLLDLIEKILVGHRSSQPSPIGIAQGDPLSSPAMELRLHHVLDLPVPSDRRVSPLPIRYVDNLLKIDANVSSITAALAEDERRLAQAGLTLKHADGPPHDLREAPIDLLGFRLAVVDAQLQVQLHPHWLVKLRKSLEEAHQRSDPRSSARNKILGWITSNGPVWRNADKSQVLSRIRRTASQTGLPGLLSSQEIRKNMDSAAQSWTQKAKGASLATLLRTKGG